MKEGVEMGKLGRVVATVSEAVEKKDWTSSKGWAGAVALLSGYKPIMGGSLVSIPRLHNCA